MSQAAQGDEGNQVLDLPSRIEAILFVADEPVSVGQMAQALQVDESQVEVELGRLATQYHARGLRLQRQNHLLQLVTAPQAAPDVERFLGLDSSSRLSMAALETLALIAYRQPITRVQVEAIRGVNCDGVLRTLLARGLVVPCIWTMALDRPHVCMCAGWDLKCDKLMMRVGAPPTGAGSIGHNPTRSCAAKRPAAPTRRGW